MIEGREFPKRFQSRVRFSSVPSDIARIVGNSKNAPMLTLMYSLQPFLESNSCNQIELKGHKVYRTFVMQVMNLLVV